MSCTCGSRAASSIVETPSVREAAIRAFSLAVTENSGRTTVPAFSVPRRMMASSVLSSFAPSCESALMCASIGRFPRTQPPGYDILTSPNLPRRGPRRTIEPRRRETSVDGISLLEIFVASICTVFPSQRIFAPRNSKREIIVTVSRSLGTF